MRRVDETRSATAEETAAAGDAHIAMGNAIAARYDQHAAPVRRLLRKVHHRFAADVAERPFDRGRVSGLGGGGGAGERRVERGDDPREDGIVSVSGRTRRRRVARRSASLKRTRISGPWRDQFRRFRRRSPPALGGGRIRTAERVTHDGARVLSHSLVGVRGDGERHGNHLADAVGSELGVAAIRERGTRVIAYASSPTPRLEEATSRARGT